MTCGHCGSPVPDTAMFCPECGADVRAQDEEDADGGRTSGDGASGFGGGASSGDGASGSGDATSGSHGQSSDAGPWSSGTADAASGSGDAASDAADAAPAAGGEASGSDDGDSEFDWGGSSVDIGDDRTEDDDLDWGVQESAGRGGVVEKSGAGGDSEDDPSRETDADDDDDQPFPEPARLSRPPDSNHPEPMMGTEGEVVGHRVGAFFVDRLLLTLLFVAPFVAAAVLEPLVADLAGVVGLVGFLGAAVAALVYTLLLEGMYGQTPGKWLFGIVVVKEDGEPCTVGASILRSVLWIVDRFYLGLVGFMLVVATDRNQRVGDMVADTVVVRTA